MYTSARNWLHRAEPSPHRISEWSISCIAHPLAPYLVILNPRTLFHDVPQYTFRTHTAHHANDATIFSQDAISRINKLHPNRPVTSPPHVTPAPLNSTTNNHPSLLRFHLPPLPSPSLTPPPHPPFPLPPPTPFQ